MKAVSEGVRVTNSDGLRMVCEIARAMVDEGEVCTVARCSKELEGVVSKSRKSTESNLVQQEV